MANYRNESRELKKKYANRGDLWPQFIQSITIDKLHGWRNQTIQFEFPIVVFVGENGIGKSTFLRAAACLYENTAGDTYFPSQMFRKTEWDTPGMYGASIAGLVRQGQQVICCTYRKTTSWGFSPRKRNGKGKGKPKRNVFFFDITRTLPLEATTGYGKIANSACREASTRYSFSDADLADISYILGVNYESGRFANTTADEKREVGLLKTGGSEISQFHQGAGESTVLTTIRALKSVPRNSLIIIDEVENSLHPRAQKRFVRFLIHLAREKCLQVIISTHSSYVYNEIPSEGRIMLVRTSTGRDVIPGASSNMALSSMDEEAHPDLFIFVEDVVAKEWLKQIIRSRPQSRNVLSRIEIVEVGPANAVGTIGKLISRRQFIHNGIAIVDGDKRKEQPECMALPGNNAPEKQVISDLKPFGWSALASRLGIDEETVAKAIGDAILESDHHDYCMCIGKSLQIDSITVWNSLVNEWCARFSDESETVAAIVRVVEEKLTDTD